MPFVIYGNGFDEHDIDAMLATIRRKLGRSALTPLRPDATAGRAEEQHVYRTRRAGGAR